MPKVILAAAPGGLYLQCKDTLIHLTPAHAAEAKRLVLLLLHSAQAGEFRHFRLAHLRLFSTEGRVVIGDTHTHSAIVFSLRGATNLTQHITRYANLSRALPTPSPN